MAKDNNIFIYSIKSSSGLNRNNLSEKQARQLSYKLQMANIPHAVFKTSKEGNEKETMDFLELTKKKSGSGDNKYDLTDDGKGKKYDGGKPMVGTLCRIFPLALMGIGKCIEFGTRKYPQPDNWKKVEDGEKRYLDSLIRHLLKYLAGQELDNETGLPHLYHVCWNALAITEFYIKRTNQGEDLLK